MMTQYCFISGTPVFASSTFEGRSLCSVPVRSVCYVGAGRARMEVKPANLQNDQGTTDVWPPTGMTDQWAEAVQRLAGSMRGISLQKADEALETADGDEGVALRYLTETNESDIRTKRELAVKRAREDGDEMRIDALREAQLRRQATGSAKEFFKGFVEVEGSYVDTGYVDENADTMGRFSKAVKSWFGKK